MIFTKKTRDRNRKKKGYKHYIKVFNIKDTPEARAAYLKGGAVELLLLEPQDSPETKKPKEPNEEETDRILYECDDIESNLKVLSELLKEEINIPEFNSTIGRYTWLKAELERLEKINENRNRYMD